ncbi:hypothetical protein [Gilliamella sp. Pas-s95]|uniref:hypothetical protein n=1 Tax=Gilliamella sp. Pas-s95 TaxID=2687317 RepID=UPI001321DB58|nr:hypothetical protein [Gilliamella sp. Pas-s95]MWN06281.1 hypothetical protein [Gilliamella sp. Pas-s95]
MNQVITKKHLKSVIYTTILSQFSEISHASLSVHTTQAIHGIHPSLSPIIEQNIDDLNLFGLSVDNKNYYGDEVKYLPIQHHYPFKNTINAAPIKQPNSNEYFDLDGDELKALELMGQQKINMTWYYTNRNNELVEFTPKDNDTFCSLSSKGMHAPFKVKLSADLILSSQYGIPNTNTYPNEDVITHPSKTYTILDDAFVCYAKPSLNPSTVKGSHKNQWNPNYGFLHQSSVNPTKNFPTTGFYGAKFDLLLSNQGIASNYIWTVKQGNALVNVTNNTNYVTVTFNTPDARNPGKAWQHVMGSGSGYTVVIEGKNKTKNTTIQYSFTLTKWFDAWKQKYNKKGILQAMKGDLDEVIEACSNKSGRYRLSHDNEVSNAKLSDKKKEILYTREIGTLFSEWGDPGQQPYPGSFGPDEDQPNSYNRYYLWNTWVGEYCDIHTYDGKYHCRDKEKEDKNGICVSIPRR